MTKLKLSQMTGIMPSGSMKGQFFSYDAIIAGAIFAVLLTLLFVYWSSLRSIIFTQIDDMFRVGTSVSNSLLTPGSPSNWDTTNVLKIGLTTEANAMRLDPGKITNLSLMTLNNYDEIREKLGVSPYDFLLVVGDDRIGIPPSPSAKGSINVSRPVVVNGIPRQMSLTIWSNFSVS